MKHFFFIQYIDKKPTIITLIISRSLEIFIEDNLRRVYLRFFSKYICNDQAVALTKQDVLCQRQQPRSRPFPQET